MKKMISLLAALVLALVCTAAFAENAKCTLIEDMEQIGKTPCTISETEYGPLDVTKGGLDNQTYVDLIKQMSFTEVDPSKTPEGEYVVLAFPEKNVRYDFFLADTQNNYFRQVRTDANGAETETLFQAKVPKELSAIANIMDSWCFSVASAQGLTPDVVANMPGPGWVLDTLEGKAYWMTDSAALELFLEDTDNYKVLINRPNSASESAEWTFAGTYDEKDGVINAVHVIFETVKYNDDGTEADRVEGYDRSSDASFRLNDKGELVCENAGDPALEGLVFERIDAPAK